MTEARGRRDAGEGAVSQGNPGSLKLEQASEETLPLSLSEGTSPKQQLHPPVWLISDFPLPGLS